MSVAPESGLFRLLKCVPGLRPAYRAARTLWWRTKDSLVASYWEAWARLHPRGGAQRVSEVWADGAADRSRVYQGEGRLWLDSTEVLWNYVFPRFGGRHWYQYLADRYCPAPRPLGLSICCGDGEVERNLLRYHICQSAEGMDISPQAIELARTRASEAGMAAALSYHVGDVERLSLDAGKYDLVVAWMALHHLRRLPHVFRQVRRALKPDGIFVINEYVGPRRFQLPDRQVAFVNTYLSVIPEHLRRKPDGQLRTRFERAPVRQIVNHDPSEAVSSHRIIPLLRRHFAIAECIGYGGTLLNWLLEDVIQNFRPSDPDHRRLLDSLYAAEQEALQSGRFASDFAFVVARRRG
ncbi:MAG: class I SAM-dependent methyltransferase [Armatimonadota bacterium]